MNPLRISALLLATLAFQVSADPVRSGKAQAELVANLASIKAGHSLTVAIRLRADPTWHTYWINPGDAGSTTSVEWDLPEGFRAGPVEFPIPHRFESSGLVGFGYEGEVLLLANITVPKELSDEEITLKAGVSWLTCDPSQCLPGSADLSLKLPVIAKEEPAPVPTKWAGPIAATLQSVPRSVPDAKATIVQEDQDWRITLVLPKGWQGFPSRPQFFPENQDFSDLSAPPKFKDIEGGFEIRVPISEYAKTMKNPIHFVFAGLKRPIRFSAAAPKPRLAKKE